MNTPLNYKEPAPIDKENHFDSMMERFEKYDVTLRIGAYIIAIEKAAKTLKIRGIYA